MKTRLVPLTKDKSALIDSSDWKNVSGYTWHYANPGIAATHNPRGSKQRLTLMHRLIMNAPPELDVDHINGDALDNRRCNLRLCTMSQNCMNKKKTTKPTSSKYKGVSWNKKSKKWVVFIQGKGNRKYIGSFTDENAAAAAYNHAAKEAFGDFARLNSLEEIPDVMAANHIRKVRILCTSRKKRKA